VPAPIFASLRERTSLPIPKALYRKLAAVSGCSISQYLAPFL